MVPPYESVSIPWLQAWARMKSRLDMGPYSNPHSQIGSGYLATSRIKRISAKTRCQRKTHDRKHFRKTHACRKTPQAATFSRDLLGALSSRLLDRSLQQV